MPRRAAMQPWLLVTIIGLAITSTVIAFVFCYTDLRRWLLETDRTSDPAATSTAATRNGALEFATVIYRPGDRTPTASFASDPWRAERFWPVATGGQLSPFGWGQNRELGEWLRRRYRTDDDILPAAFAADRLAVECDDGGWGESGATLNRTRQSALATIAGTFGWTKAEIDASGLRFNASQDIGRSGRCPALRQWLKRAHNRYEVPRMADDSTLIAGLRNDTGEQLPGLRELRDLYDTLWIERLYGRRMPDWVTKLFAHSDFSGLALGHFGMLTSERALIRLQVGALLKSVLERMERKCNGDLRPDRSVWLYAVRDDVLVALLAALRVFDEPHFPPYCATIVFELRRVHNEPFVQMFYRNGSSTDAQLLNVPGCGRLCPLQRLFEALADVLPGVSAADDCAHLLPDDVAPASKSGADVMPNYFALALAVVVTVYVFVV